MNLEVSTVDVSLLSGILFEDVAFGREVTQDSET
jgi:hypothetical protein